jgi:hypothetical protein
MNMVSDCEFCGRQVILCRDPDHPRVMRAMDPVEHRITMPAYWTRDGDGYIRPGGAMLKHQCPAAEMTNYVVFSLAASQRGARVVAAAHARPCPKCGAQAGTECWNISERKRGVDTHTVNPHSERYEPLEGEEPISMENPDPIRSDDVEGAIKWATGEIDEEYT